MKKLAWAAAALTVATLAWAATPDEVIEESFFPYKKGTPSVAGLKAGMVINKGNVDSVKDALDPANYQFVKDGLLEITVGPTTSFDQPKSFIEATTKNFGKVKLGDKLGELEGYVAGRPFPQEPDPNDPRAGEKLAWNYKYGLNWGDSAAIYPFYWTFRNLETGKTERVIKFNFHFLNFKHRIDQEPIPEITPNPADYYRGIYVKVLDPLDIKDTQLLIQRYADDTKRDEANLYLGFQRRVRRLASGQITDAFLGTDLMIEDFEGYNGRISDMNWKYKGTANVLMPYYNHNELKLAEEYKEPDGYQFVAFGGKGNCFQNITWQLRKAYILESDPVDPAHPISKRIHYYDAQTATLNRTLIYDRKGELWKSFTIGKAHPDFHLPVNKGTGIAIDDSFSMVDVQAKHCTTGQFKGQVSPKLNPVGLFSVQNMRGGN